MKGDNLRVTHKMCLKSSNPLKSKCDTFMHFSEFMENKMFNAAQHIFT